MAQLTTKTHVNQSFVMHTNVKSFFFGYSSLNAADICGLWISFKQPHVPHSVIAGNYVVLTGLPGTFNTTPCLLFSNQKSASTEKQMIFVWQSLPCQPYNSWKSTAKYILN